jgi:hypothetical protein
MTDKVKPDPNARIVARMTYVRNLGNYESIHIDLGVERDVPEGVGYIPALRILRKEVEAELEVAVQEVDQDRKKD